MLLSSAGIGEGDADATSPPSPWNERTALISLALYVVPAVERTTGDPRYSAARNRATPRKIGSQLRLFDCINCDKCVPVCPNSANFVYLLEPKELDLPVIECSAEGARRISSERVAVKEAHQLANLADFCNDCGNCDVFCPEDGGPFLQKPRFFLSPESWRAQQPLDGFCFETASGLDRMLGRIDGREYLLEVDGPRDRWIFTGAGVRCVFSGEEVEPRVAELLNPGEAGTRKADLRCYWIMRMLFFPSLFLAGAFWTPFQRAPTTKG